MSIPPRSIPWRLTGLLIITIVIVASSTLLGPTRLGWADDVFWQLRVPRTLLAAVAGAALAIGGVIFQTLFRNPLAEPYTLGVASGASLGAAIGYLLGVSGTIGQAPVLGLLAFAGALAAMSAVYLMGRLRGGRDMTRLLLAGVCVAYLCAAGIMLVTYLANRAVTNDIVVWMMGSLAVLRPRASLEIACVLAPVLIFIAVMHRGLDLLILGDDLAASRGVPVTRIVWSSYLLVGLLTAAVVANCGPIGFVGLMVPHMSRAVAGYHTLPLTLAAGLIGAAFLAACDGIARAMLVYELPVGVITNIIGAVFFFFLLGTRDAVHASQR